MTSIMSLRYLPAAILAAMFTVPVSPPPRTASTELTADLEKVAATAPGILGVRVLHVESGDGASVNGGEWFPMMSVYKLPIAVHALGEAERGRLDLSRQVRLTAADRRPGLSPLARTIEEKGPQSLSILELISAVMRISDNTASDALLRAAGGPRAVSSTLARLGLNGIDVSRYELEFAADYHGVCCLERMKPYTLEKFMAAVERVAPAARRRAARAYIEDRRDSAQPDAMAALLARLVNGAVLNAEHTRWLLDEMAEMHSRDTRLRAGLPPGTRASLRPGTSGETDGIRAAHNDNAVVVLPGNRGHLVIAAFLKGSRGPESARDATLEQVARTAYRWASGRR
jgi:beta-lactamase class A